MICPIGNKNYKKLDHYQTDISRRQAGKNRKAEKEYLINGNSLKMTNEHFLVDQFIKLVNLKRPGLPNRDSELSADVSRLTTLSRNIIVLMTKFKVAQKESWFGSQRQKRDMILSALEKEIELFKNLISKEDLNLFLIQNGIDPKGFSECSSKKLNDQILSMIKNDSALVQRQLTKPHLILLNEIALTHSGIFNQICLKFSDNERRFLSEHKLHLSIVGKHISMDSDYPDLINQNLLDTYNQADIPQNDLPQNNQSKADNNIYKPEVFVDGNNSLIIKSGTQQVTQNHIQAQTYGFSLSSTYKRLLAPFGLIRARDNKPISASLSIESFFAEYDPSTSIRFLTGDTIAASIFNPNTELSLPIKLMTIFSIQHYRSVIGSAVQARLLEHNLIFPIEREAIQNKVSQHFIIGLNSIDETNKVYEIQIKSIKKDHNADAFLAYEASLQLGMAELDSILANFKGANSFAVRGIHLNTVEYKNLMDFKTLSYHSNKLYYTSNSKDKAEFDSIQRWIDQELASQQAQLIDHSEIFELDQDRASEVSFDLECLNNKTLYSQLVKGNHFERTSTINEIIPSKSGVISYERLPYTKPTNLDNAQSQLPKPIVNLPVNDQGVQEPINSVESRQDVFLSMLNRLLTANFELVDFNPTAVPADIIDITNNAIELVKSILSYNIAITKANLDPSSMAFVPPSPVFIKSLNQVLATKGNQQITNMDLELLVTPCNGKLSDKLRGFMLSLDNETFMVIFNDLAVPEKNYMINNGIVRPIFQPRKLSANSLKLPKLSLNINLDSLTLRLNGYIPIKTVVDNYSLTKYNQEANFPASVKLLYLLLCQDYQMLIEGTIKSLLLAKKKVTTSLSSTTDSSRTVLLSFIKSTVPSYYAVRIQSFELGADKSALIATDAILYINKDRVEQIWTNPYQSEEFAVNRAELKRIIFKGLFNRETCKPSLDYRDKVLSEDTDSEFVEYQNWINENVMTRYMEGVGNPLSKRISEELKRIGHIHVELASCSIIDKA